MPRKAFVRPIFSEALAPLHPVTATLNNFIATERAFYSTKSSELIVCDQFCFVPGPKSDFEQNMKQKVQPDEQSTRIAYLNRYGVITRYTEVALFAPKRPWPTGLLM